jgi:hypothetical protein
LPLSSLPFCFAINCLDDSSFPFLLHY